MKDWSTARLVAFRFAALYFVLYTFPFPLAYVPALGGLLTQATSWAWNSSAPWVASNLLGIEYELYLGPTGSGDTTLAYVKLFMMLVLAGAGALVWSLLDRRRPNHNCAGRWLEVGCRFYLGITMLTYGIAKVIPTQFMQPSLDRLLTTWGDSSPMGLVWTFMGFSPAYTIFSGVGETLGGLLVLFRRTRTAGALVIVAVMSNVAMLNYAYDVPVKLFSSHLLLMAIALILLDGRRVAALLVRNRAAAAVEFAPLLPSTRANRAATVLGVLLVGAVIFGAANQALMTYRVYGNGRERPELYGIWDVSRFELEGEERLPLLTDPERWRALVIDRALPVTIGAFELPGTVAVQGMDGVLTTYAVRIDDERGTMRMVARGETVFDAPGTDTLGDLRFTRTGSDDLELRGTWQGADVLIQLTARDLDSIELTSRGYHWINELPRNR